MRLAGLLGALLFVGCKATPPETPVTHAALNPSLTAPLAETFDRALAAESRDPLAAEGYLAAIDASIARWNDPWAAPVVAAALDRLVWPTGELGIGADHALVHRSRPVYSEVAARLTDAHRRAERHPILGPLLAYSLHEMAIETGAELEAADLRRRAGCVAEATAWGPLAWPGLEALDADLGLSTIGPLPADLPGVAPFSTKLTPVRSDADVCVHSFEAAGSNAGLRALVVDLVTRHDGWVYVTLGGRSPARVDLGGETLIRRERDLTDAVTLSFARAWLPAGRARLLLKLASSGSDSASLQVVDGEGQPVSMVAPAPGDVADARATRSATLELVPEPKNLGELATATSADLALGLDRRAARRLEASTLSAGESPAYLDRLRRRAYADAGDRRGSALDDELRAVVARMVASCPDCWHARITAANTAIDRLGSGEGLVAALGYFGLGAGAPEQALERLSSPELAYIARLTSHHDFLDISRRAFDLLKSRASGSSLLAEVDAALHPKNGAEGAAHACEGGLSRGGTDCLFALFANDEFDAAFRELARLRRLRGSPSLHRKLELGKLLAHGEIERAARLYEALPPAVRDSAVLALLPNDEGRRRLARDVETLGDSPYGLEPLARLLGVVRDPSVDLEAEGAALVAKDRAQAFLPDAGTAVLRHLERYHLSDRGLLVHWTYDLRRVSDTEDVASRAEADNPSVFGQWTTRMLRRKIHKRDGRVLDPDPKASGHQGHTDLSQLEQGDYVEQIAIGWALPGEHGQLVVDTPDAMPERTSVRELEIELDRPTDVPLQVWSHALLGSGRTEARGDRLKTVWSLRDKSPRRMEQGVPVLEASVGVSFGTNSIERIGRGLRDYVRRREENDPFIGRWVAEVLGPSAATLSPSARVSRLMAAVGRTVRLGQPRSVTDHVGAFGGQSDDSARTILESGTGSRTWVLYRALREAGIERSLAISETEPYSASPGFPTHLGRFNHPLVRAVVDGKTLWLDADVEGPPLPPGRVSPELRGRIALVEDGSLVPVDASVGDDADAIELALTLDANGDAEGSFRAVVRGIPAQRFAGALETLVGEQRTNLLRSIVQGWAPWADVRDVALSSDDGSWQIEVTARLVAASFALAESRDGAHFSLPGFEPFHAVLPAPTASSLTSRYAGQPDRASALSVDTPLFYRVKRTVKLAPGTTVERIAPRFELAEPELVARREVTQRGDVIEETFELNLPVRVVQPEALDGFVDQLKAVDDGFAHGTLASSGAHASSSDSKRRTSPKPPRQAGGRGAAMKPVTKSATRPVPGKKGPRGKLR